MVAKRENSWAFNMHTKSINMKSVLLIRFSDGEKDKPICHWKMIGTNLLPIDNLISKININHFYDLESLNLNISFVI